MNDLDFAASMHKYRVSPDGPFCPGVTTCIDVLSKADERGDPLCQGAANETARIAVFEPRLTKNDNSYYHLLRYEYKRRWEVKAGLGTHVHDHALAWSQGKDIDALPDEQGCLDALYHFMDEKQPIWIDLEFMVGEDHISAGYGGRGDFLALIDNFVTLGDYKTGKEYPLEHGLQLAGLSMAEKIVYQDGMVLARQPLPVVERFADVYLRDDGTYVMREPEADYRPLFLSLVQAWWDRERITMELREQRENAE